MIPLHALVLTLMGRFSNRLYIAYSTWYAVGTLASMQVPFVGFQPVSTSEHMAALGKSFVSAWSKHQDSLSALRRVRAPATCCIY